MAMTSTFNKAKEFIRKLVGYIRTMAELLF